MRSGAEARGQEGGGKETAQTIACKLIFRPVTCTDEAILVGIKTPKSLQVLTPAMSMHPTDPGAVIVLLRAPLSALQVQTQPWHNPDQ